MDRFTITVQGWDNSAEAVKVFEQIKDLLTMTPCQVKLALVSDEMAAHRRMELGR